jgi:hypothetical protein
MGDLQALERKILARMAAAGQRVQLNEEHRQRHLAAREQRKGLFTAVSDRLLRQLIRPRLAKLADHVGLGRPAHAEDAGRTRCLYVFGPAEPFPVTARLELAVHHDQDIEKILLLYRLEVLPAPFPFPAEDRLVLPLEAVAEPVVATWVEEKLLQFLDLYLRVVMGGQLPEWTAVLPLAA